MKDITKDTQALNKRMERLIQSVKEQTAQSGNPCEMRFTKKDEWKGETQ